MSIYGKALRAIKGKTVRSNPDQVQIELDNTVIEKQIIILCGDLMNFVGFIF